MPDSQEDLRATEESIRGDAERVKGLEEEKAALDPKDPRVQELSEEVGRLSASLEDKATAERELSEDIQATR
jgi:hypothetical protein